MASISVLRRNQQLPWRLRSTWTRAAFSTSHSNPRALRSQGHSGISSSGPPPDSGGCSPPHLSQWVTKSNVVGGGGGQRSRRKPRGAGLVPPMAPRCPRVQLRPGQALGAEGRDRSQRACKCGDGEPSWEVGSPDSQGHGKQAHRQCGAACSHEGWAWPGRFPNPSGLLAPSALVRGEGPGVAGAEFTHPERPKAGGVWAGLGVPA